MNRRHLLISAAATAASTALLPSAMAQRQPRSGLPVTQRHPGVYVDQGSNPATTTFIPRALDLAVFVGPLASDLPTGSLAQTVPGMPLPPGFDLAAPVVDAFRAQGGERALLVHAGDNEDGLPDYDAALDALDAQTDTAFTLIYLVGATGPADAPDLALTSLYQRALLSARAGFATLIIDAPDESDDYERWRVMLGITDPDIAAYAPWLVNARGERLPPGPAVMGRIMATTASDGVWKAPAGLDAQILYHMTRPLDPSDLDTFNRAHVNPIRTAPQYGTVLWGARTFSDTSDTIYLPVRRLQRWIEASLPDSLAWTRGEPNAPALWAAVIAEIEVFLTGLYRDGAFMGATPDQSYFVQCGLGSTMTQTDIDAGQVVVQIGVAPVRPAEFVIIAYQMSLEDG
ncbi:phage tail sheath C-terminal domain-containing protein [Maricaulis sp.]|uniref:phage tail sheath family protein n=1 Tax=Maricaulis sp. TaxID=1486257 RepID=UPI0025C18733|nr:phage tail sheath C-terminal domain-containing protein [Maricaulis sp.]